MTSSMNHSNHLNDAFSTALSEYDFHPGLAFWQQPNCKRIDLSCGTVDGIPVADLEKKLANHDSRFFLTRWPIRWFTDIEKQRALLVYYYCREYQEAREGLAQLEGAHQAGQHTVQSFYTLTLLARLRLAREKIIVHAKLVSDEQAGYRVQGLSAFSSLSDALKYFPERSLETPLFEWTSASETNFSAVVSQTEQVYHLFGQEVSGINDDALVNQRRVLKMRRILRDYETVLAQDYEDTRWSIRTKVSGFLQQARASITRLFERKAAYIKGEIEPSKPLSDENKPKPVMKVTPLQVIPETPAPTSVAVNALPGHTSSIETSKPAATTLHPKPTASIDDIDGDIPNADEPNTDVASSPVPPEVRAVLTSEAAKATDKTETGHQPTETILTRWIQGRPALINFINDLNKQVESGQNSFDNAHREIKKIYYVLSKIYHPDRASEIEKDDATAVFQALRCIIEFVMARIEQNEVFEIKMDATGELILNDDIDSMSPEDLERFFEKMRTFFQDMHAFYQETDAFYDDMLAFYKERNETYAELSQTLAELFKQMGVLDLAVAELHEALKNQRAEIQAQGSEIAEQRTEIAEQRTEIAEQQTEIAEQQTEIEAQRTEIAAHAARQTDLGAKLSVLEKQFSLLEQQLADLAETGEAPFHEESSGTDKTEPSLSPLVASGIFRSVSGTSLSSLTTQAAQNLPLKHSSSEDVRSTNLSSENAYGS